MPGQVIKTWTTIKSPWHQGQNGGGSSRKSGERVAQMSHFKSTKYYLRTEQHRD